MHNILQAHLRSHSVIEAVNHTIKKGHVYLAAEIQQTHGLFCCELTYSCHPAKLEGQKAIDDKHCYAYVQPSYPAIALRRIPS